MILTLGVALCVNVVGVILFVLLLTMITDLVKSGGYSASIAIAIGLGVLLILLWSTVSIITWLPLVVGG